uniref:Uncharacterized protein n=1 Tax=Rhizophagus irregularis (strain DAOM 181602 / DAOM 197198 / MUCL 43194) TaxID=747089 RepID=U9TQH5_RHIID
MDSILKESVLTNKQSKKIIRFSSTAWRRFWLGHSPKVWDNLSCGENFFEKSKSWQYINVISLMYLHYNINYVQASRRISDEKMEEDAGKIFYYLYEVVTAYLYIGVIPYLSSYYRKYLSDNRIEYINDSVEEIFRFYNN